MKENRTLQLVGLTREQVVNICAKHFGTGIRGRFLPNGPTTDPKKVERIIQMRSEGLRNVEIAREVGVAASTVSHILNGRSRK